MPHNEPDTAGPGDTGSTLTDDFKLLDIEDSAQSRSYTGSAVRGSEPEVPLSVKATRLAWTGMNVVLSCSALAVAKQILNPASYGHTDVAAQEATKQLPSWFAGQYQQKRFTSAVTQRVLRDTGVLLAASGLWYGLQIGLKKLRDEEDAVNVCIAGTVSAGFLGATFFEPVRWSRAGMWGAVGGLAGYFGYQEQVALRAALLEKQQQLEQKHMHVDTDKVHQKLDSQLLKQLLQLEHKEKQEQLRQQLQQQGVQVPSSSGGQGVGSSSSGSGGGGGQQAATGRVQQGDNEDEWHRLLSSAPWLQEQDKDKDQQQ